MSNEEDFIVKNNIDISNMIFRESDLKYVSLNTIPRASLIRRSQQDIHSSTPLLSVTARNRNHTFDLEESWKSALESHN